MGIIVSCLGISSSKHKDSRKAKKDTQTPKTHDLPNPQQQSQLSPSQQQQPTPVVQEGLADEHPSSAPPPAQTQVQARAEGVESEVNAIRKVGVEAPVPLPATTTDNISTTKDKVAQGKKDNMATDEEYMSFLDKANQDPNEGTAKSQSSGKVELKAVDNGVKVPEAISKVLGKGEAFYVSDADEPFVGVALKLGKGKGLPDEATFAKLVHHPKPKEADVQIMDIGEWDTQGQYKDVVDATREATKGSDVRVYRIAKDGSRVEYWVVGVEGGNLVGVKALAIES